ncbi:hypothetical protein D3C75_1284160 [compost metagenome]
MSFSNALKKRLITMAITVAKAIPFMLKVPQVKLAPLMPMTSTMVVRIMFTGLE